jgi:predicted TIM-barrel fold metal-dependent hydrolase
MFYGVILHCRGNLPSLMCGYEFFGVDHMLFGTDMPFDGELGAWVLRYTVDSVKKMSIPEEEENKIFKDNAIKVCHLSVQ